MANDSRRIKTNAKVAVIVGVGGTVTAGPIGGGILGFIGYKISSFFTKKLTKKLNS